MTRHYLSAIAAVATALSLSACADPISAPVGPLPSSFAAALTTAATLTPEKLISGSMANSVNEKGETVGYGTGAICARNQLPRLWRADGTMVNLPTGTSCAGNAYFISNTGYIVGELYNPEARALWTPNGSGGYDLQVLEPANGRLLHFEGINDVGEIVASYMPIGGKVPEIYYRTTSSTSWTAVQAPAGATACTLGGINNNGAFVGYCYVNGAALTGYLWANHDATPTQLPRPATPNNVYAKDINDAGVIVGFIGDCAILRALRWTLSDGVYKVEILPDAGKGASAVAVSRDGTVAGGVYKGGGINGTATLWPTSGGYQLLPLIGRSSQSSGAGDITITSAGATIVVGAQDGQAVRWK